MQYKKPKKRITVKARVELEKRFLGSILMQYSDTGDIRKRIVHLKDRLGICWRNFRDKRHRAIWRALEALNLRSVEERMEILEKEMYAADEERVKEDPRLESAKEAWETPGSAGAKDFKKKLIEGSRGLLWLERELDAAGVFPVVGGKKYLRDIAEIGEAELLSPEHLAELGLFGR